MNKNLPFLTLLTWLVFFSLPLLPLLLPPLSDLLCEGGEGGRSTWGRASGRAGSQSGPEKEGAEEDYECGNRERERESEGR